MKYLQYKILLHAEGLISTYLRSMQLSIWKIWWHVTFPLDACRLLIWGSRLFHAVINSIIFLLNTALT